MKKLIFVCTILCLSLCMIYVNNSNCNAMVKEIHSNNIKKYIDEKETFIAYYDIDKNTTDIYTGTDIDVIINQKKCGIIHRKPKYPTKLLFGNIDILRKGHIINKIISYNSENDESERPTIIGSDDRVIVEAHKRYTMPVCATADLTESYGYPSGFNNNMVYCSGYVTDKYYCTIETSLDSSHGQSGSPIFTQGGYAIGILHGGNGEATFGRQLETGLTSWLNDKGYFD